MRRKKARGITYAHFTKGKEVHMAVFTIEPIMTDMNYVCSVDEAAAHGYICKPIDSFNLQREGYHMRYAMMGTLRFLFNHEIF